MSKRCTKRCCVDKEDSVCCNNLPTSTKLLDNIVNLDIQMNDNIDFMQNQINNINNSYKEIINEILIENNRYKILVDEVNNINEKIDDIEIKLIESGCSIQYDGTCNHGCGKMIYTDVTKINVFVVEHDIEFLYLTMVAGGGAGGIGFVDGIFYYSGGGGGGGSCIINKPISVTKGTILHIKVGSGGDSKSGRHGSDSYVEILYTTHKKEIILTSGGANGHPTKDMDHDVSGGCGGHSHLCMFDGCNGHPGETSIPSHGCSKGGCGGTSIFYKGGNGGGNYFGTGGKGGTIDRIVGENGKYGSGGGGSCPKLIIDPTERLSGNGGDGVVIIEW